MSKAGKMSRATFTAVVKCLHPDQRGKATEQEKTEACGLFTQWKKDQDKH
jgi:hypothetical protein